MGEVATDARPSWCASRAGFWWSGRRHAELDVAVNVIKIACTSGRRRATIRRLRRCPDQPVSVFAVSALALKKGSTWGGNDSTGICKAEGTNRIALAAVGLPRCLEADVAARRPGPQASAVAWLSQNSSTAAGSTGLDRSQQILPWRETVAAAAASSGVGWGQITVSSSRH